MDEETTTQIVAAILAGHAAQEGSNTSATAYVKKYIAMLNELKEKKAEIEEALSDYDPEQAAKLVD